MKEATGELNMAVVVSISIGILAAFFFGIIWPMLKGNFNATSQCNKAVCNCSEEYRNEDNECLCAETKDGLSNSSETFYCPFKG